VDRDTNNLYILNPEKSILENPERVDFLFVQINEKYLVDHVKIQLDIERHLEDKGLFVEAVWSSLVVASCPFKLGPSELDNQNIISDISAHFLQTYKEKIKILHGRSLGVFGCFGTIEENNYCKGGCIISDIDSVFESLFKIDYGSVEVYR
jgi:hypothetical protein